MSSGIKPSDSDVDRFAKVLPADVTAAFLSIQAALNQSLSDSSSRAASIWWSFVAITVICPFYFSILLDVKNWLQNFFLTLSFIVFATSIAHTDFAEYFGGGYTKFFLVVAIVFPIVWAFLITPMFVRVFGNQLAQVGTDPTPSLPEPDQVRSDVAIPLKPAAGE